MDFYNVNFHSSSSDHSYASPPSAGADTPDFPSVVAQRLRREDDGNWSNSTPPKTPPAVGQLGNLNRFGPPSTHVLTAKLNELQKSQVDILPPKKLLNRLPAPSVPVPPPPPGLVGSDNGAVVSVGSIGHPHTCKQACPYVKRKGGCKDGAQCTRCHLCFWQRASVREAQRQRVMQDAASQQLATSAPAPPPAYQDEAGRWNVNEQTSFNGSTSAAPSYQIDSSNMNFNMHSISGYSSRSESQYSNNNTTNTTNSTNNNNGYPGYNNNGSINSKAAPTLAAPPTFTDGGSNYTSPAGLCPPPPPPPSSRTFAPMIDHGVMKLAFSGELSTAHTSRQASGDLVPAPGLTGDDEEGPASVGSIGHPHNCGQACKYHSKGKGCKDGRWCVRCHICPWRRFQQEGTKRQQPEAPQSMGMGLAPCTAFNRQPGADAENWRAASNTNNSSSYFRQLQPQPFQHYRM